MEPGVRHCAVLITDIAATVALRSQLGDAAASRRIRHLLDAITAAVQARGGEVIKSYGDDVLAVFEHAPIPSAAAVAITAQRLAAEAQLPLYAGLHAGPVEFRITMGHPDALGLTVNIAARLHKLTEDAPGQIFLAATSVAELTSDLRAQARRFGVRTLKGVGETDIWTLDWHELHTLPQTVFMDSAGLLAAPGTLLLHHAGNSVRLSPSTVAVTLGRGMACTLQIPDPVPRVSGAHLVVECVSGQWFAQDISRNGTWLKDRRGGETMLPYCVKAPLPAAGALCLGRAFEDADAAGFVVDFRVDAA